MRVPFLGPTYNGRSNFLDPTRCINFYPEINPNPNPKSSLSLIGTSGLLKALDTSRSTIRGLYGLDQLYVVADNLFFSWDGTTLTQIGQLSTNTGPVIMKDNGSLGHQICVVDGSVYIYDTIAKTLVQPSSYPKLIHLAYIDGYFVGVDDELTHYTSDLYNGLVWNALAQGLVLSTTDKLRGIAYIQQQLVMIKQGSCEFWYDAGVATSMGSPFARVPGAMVAFGTDASYSITAGPNSSVIFLGFQRLGDNLEFVGVVQLSGYTPQIISPPAINYRINQFSVKSDAIGYSYSEDGHTFYVLTFPTADATFVYDFTTQLWHERSSYRESDSPDVVGRHRGNCYACFNGTHYVGDYNSGKVFQMSSNVYSDDGDPIISTRIAPISYDLTDLEAQFIHRFYVDIEVGVTDPSLVVDPKAMLSWSNDSGFTWSNTYEATLGKVGEYRTRLIWRRLGGAINRVFKLTISEPIRKILVDSYADIS